MNAKILKFERRQKEMSTQEQTSWETFMRFWACAPKEEYRVVRSSDMPSLEDMCAVLIKNYSILDDVDKSYFFLVERMCRKGDKATIGDIEGCRAIAWSMMKRYRLT